MLSNQRRPAITMEICFEGWPNQSISQYLLQFEHCEDGRTACNISIFVASLPVSVRTHEIAYSDLTSKDDHSRSMQLAFPSFLGINRSAVAFVVT